MVNRAKIFLVTISPDGIVVTFCLPLKKAQRQAGKAGDDIGGKAHYSDLSQPGALRRNHRRKVPGLHERYLSVERDPSPGQRPLQSHHPGSPLAWPFGPGGPGGDRGSGGHSFCRSDPEHRIRGQGGRRLSRPSGLGPSRFYGGPVSAPAKSPIAARRRFTVGFRAVPGRPCPASGKESIE